MPTRNELLMGLDHILWQLKQDYDTSRYLPMLEDDIVAYLYHSLVSKQMATVQNIHVKTRVRALDGLHPDLVVGELSGRYHGSESVRQVEGRLVVEVKFFFADARPLGFPEKERKIKDDIDKLAKLGKRNPESACVVLCVDEIGFLDDADLCSLEQRASKKNVLLRYLRLERHGSTSDTRAAPKSVWVGTRKLEVGRRLVARYRGKEYEAKVTERGTVLYDDREYSSLTAAGCAVSRLDICEGPKFWGIK